MTFVGYLLRLLWSFIHSGEATCAAKWCGRERIPGYCHYCRRHTDEIVRAMGAKPLSVSDVGGCTCIGNEPYGCTRVGDTFTWRIDPGCRYHQAAAEQPWNHRIPWNCPTYWDGCNCEGGPFYSALTWPAHPPSCKCLGRGWFQDHYCVEGECPNPIECVGCHKRYQQCEVVP